ncbi:MAG TPA: hypothetical protein VMH87_05280 [Pseudomonadales bacterium]|nr:hypothetical protein [Pseudomonadales bacterium]
MKRDLYVRKNWIGIGAYYAFTSAAVGSIIAALLFLRFVSGSHSAHRHINAVDAMVVLTVILSVVMLIIQLITGPFIFTKGVICRACGEPRTLARIPFFAYKGYRQPKCVCGGNLEPVFFWKLKPSHVA